MTVSQGVESVITGFAKICPDIAFSFGGVSAFYLAVCCVVSIECCLDNKDQVG